MIDLLKYHDKAEEKLKNLKDISIDVHPGHPDTKRFMIIRNNGAKEGFRLSKCINTITSKVKET